MKTIVRILMTAAAVMMFANFASAQQYLCETAGALVKSYEAGDLASSGTTVEWTISVGGPAITNSTSTTCSIDWNGVAAGTYTLTLTETHSSGLCTGVETLTIYVNEKPSASFALTGSTVCNGQEATMVVNITSDSDWSLVYNDGVNPDVTETGSAGTFDIVVGGVVANATYTLVSIANLGCTLADGNQGDVLSGNTTHDLEAVVLAPTITPL